jgi:hypothetical protein
VPREVDPFSKKMLLNGWKQCHEIWSAAVLNSTLEIFKIDTCQQKKSKQSEFAVHLLLSYFPGLPNWKDCLMYYVALTNLWLYC